MEGKELCIICAWRATCQKQFSMKSGQKCPYYCKDMTLRESEGAAEESGAQRTK